MPDQQPPWATGPAELLQHGLDLLAKDTDATRRFAMIAIDNAVELTIKTYLGLPKRVTGLGIPRKEYHDISESFPALLEALEKYASSKLSGVDLGEIEWYHRLRNQLYHQGNGLTAERKKVEVYAQLAKLLFSNLFGCEVTPAAPTVVFPPTAEFLTAFYVLERAYTAAANKDPEPGRPVNSLSEAVRQLKNAGVLSINDAVAVEDLRAIRNRVVHAEPGSEQFLTRELIDRSWELAGRFPSPPTTAA